MAENRSDFGYEQTLLYGRYTKDLGNFAKFQALRLKKQKTDIGKTDAKPQSKFWVYLARCTRVRDVIFQKIGEDWVFLTLLGIINAILSFSMDFIIEKCQEAKVWLYRELAFSVPLQYVSWVAYSLLFILFATGFTHLVSPQAIGSGIPEMKTILRGVVLKEYLTFKTLIAKVVGLCATLGSTLPLGKEGPFVHVASIVATLLGKISSFSGIYENESRRTEMLAAACAVGVAGTFAAPIGGVLFSIEVTSTYFAVRNYWRGFFSAVCGAVVFRLMGVWFTNEATITALFKTNLRQEFPFDALELLAFSFIGVACGFGGALYILLHRKIILFLRRHKNMSSFLQKNRFIYPGIIALVISSLTFPPGLGQFFAGELTSRQAVNELFSNITWTYGQADDLLDEEIISHWKHPLTNIYVNLVLYIVLNFIFGAFCNTLPIPAGAFMPVFTIGAGFGRLIGESMAAWFPNGIPSGDIIRKIVPGGYAVVGAASMAGAVTRTISTSVIVFELTGQISHVLPAVIAVLIANAIANLLQPSFYDSIIKLKRLPYLPDIISRKASSWNLFVEDFMVKKPKLITFTSKYKDLKELLESSRFRSYPLVDNPDSMVLLGSIHRFELSRMMYDATSHNQKVFLPDDDNDDTSGFTSPNSSQFPSRDPSPLPEPPVARPVPRFQVVKVEEDPNSLRPDPLRIYFPKPTSATSLEDMKEKETYHTLQLPLRSILKKSSSSPRLAKSASHGDLGDLASLQKRSSVSDNNLESVTVDTDRTHFQPICKKVRLPPEPVKVKNLPEFKREEWERAQLEKSLDWEGCQIDPAPFQLVERTSLHKVHSLFSLLGLSHAYVTNTGRLIGVVGLKELRRAIQGRLDEQAGVVTDDEDTDAVDPDQLDVDIIESEHQFTLVKENGDSSDYGASNV